MITTMILNATAQIAYLAGYIPSMDKVEIIAGATGNSADTFIHWMFCYTYLKLSIEVTYMFDRRIYTIGPETMQEINRKNFCLNTAFVINILFCVVLLIYPLAERRYQAMINAWNIALCL